MTTMAGDDDRSTERAEMVERIMLHGQVAAGERGGITLSPRVLEAMGAVPRHEFVPENVSELAYADSPLPIGHGKTISQPFIVALMVELLDIQPEDRVLEVGTGLGYHAAVLASLADEVYTVELIPELAESAAGRLARAGATNVTVRAGDGGRGWKEHAPFDKISAAAAPEHVPPALLEQLRPGGRLVLPLGPFDEQTLVLVTRDEHGDTTTTRILPVRFSTLTLTH